VRLCGWRRCDLLDKLVLQGFVMFARRDNDCKTNVKQMEAACSSAYSRCAKESVEELLCVFALLYCGPTQQGLDFLCVCCDRICWCKH
jgi:hypothetical protein